MHLIDRCWKTKIDVNYGWSNFSLLSRIVTSNPMLPCNLSILIPSVFVLKQVFFLKKMHLKNCPRNTGYSYIKFSPVLFSLMVSSEKSL